MTRALRPSRIVLICLLTWTLGSHDSKMAASAAAQTPEGESSAPPEFFIEAEVDNLEPYLGQQITYTIRRYQATEFPDQPHYEVHPFAGFRNTPLLQRPVYTSAIAGREYLVHPTHIALFPTVPGRLIIDPTRLVIPGDSGEADTIVASEAIFLEVQPWPPDSPTNFDGAVGQFEIAAEFSESVVDVDQPVRLVVTIKGTGNIEALAEPTIPVMQNWRFSGSSGSQTTSNVPLSQNVVEGIRRFEWQLVPLEAGSQFFPGIEFTYFDPQTETYDSLRTGPISITVLPLEDESTFVSPLPETKQEVRRFTSDIRHIKPVPTDINVRVEIAGLRQTLLLGCLILPLAAVGGAWYWRYRHSRRPIARPKTRRRQARRKARKVLATAQRSGGDANVAVRIALTEYLEDTLGRSVTGLTTDQLVTVLNESRLDPDLVARIRALLARVDAHRFAPIDDEAASTRSLIASTRVLIDDLDLNLSKRPAQQ